MSNRIHDTKSAAAYCGLASPQSMYNHISEGT